MSSPVEFILMEESVKFMKNCEGGGTSYKNWGPLDQGWANFFVGGPNEKSEMSGGPT
jgi:hypothetical protein